MLWKLTVFGTRRQIGKLLRTKPEALETRVWATVHITMLVMAWGVLALPPAVAQSDLSELQFVQGLRQRGLYSLAELYCLQRLQQSDLPPGQRAQLVLEFSLTYAQHALATQGQERQQLWDQAQKVLDEHLPPLKQSDWKFVFQVQKALVELEKALAAYYRAEAHGMQGTWATRALEHLRTAIAQLNQAQKDLDQRRRWRQVPSGWETLPQQRLLLLGYRIRYHLGWAYRLRAELYPADSPDRTLAAREGLDLLDELARQKAFAPLHWEASQEVVRCYRLLGRLGAARGKLNTLALEYTDPRRRLRLRALELEVALAAEDQEEAEKIVRQGRQLEQATDPLLDFLHLKFYLAAWKTAKQQNHTQAQKRWQQALQQQLALIRQSHGGFWARRAQALVSAALTGAALSGQLALLARRAGQLAQLGQVEQALKVYDQAVAQAQAQGADEEAFTLAYAAATLVHKRDSAQALQRFRQAALLAPHHAQAPEAHLLAISHAGKLVRKGQWKLEQLVQLLQEHLNRWPEASTAPRVRLALARVLLHQGHAQQAVQVAQRTPPGTQEFQEALTLTHTAFQQWYATHPKARATVAEQAARWYESVLLGPQGQWPLQWTLSDHQAALFAARWNLVPEHLKPDRARQLLQQALQHCSDPRWQARHQAWLVLAQVLREQKVSPKDQSSGLQALPGDLLELAVHMDHLAQSASPALRTRLVPWLYQVARHLAQSSKLPTAQKARLRPILARAALWHGRTKEAEELFGQLHRQYPRRREYHQGLALAMTQSGDPERMQKALEHWRALQRRSRPGSPPWFQARYYLAWLHMRLGNPDQARRIVQLTEVLHPGLDKGLWQQRFQELKTQLGLSHH